MAAQLELAAIRATSPTLAEVMRSCLLRAGLSQASGSSNFVLGNPKGWLGSAYHEVLEKIPHVDLGKETLDGVIERLWDEAIASQSQYASSHPLDRRFGPPTTWPGYYMTLASVRLRALEIAAASAPASLATLGPVAGSGGVLTTIREQEFAAYGGRLVGRPDVIRASEVVDYKSGGIFDYDEDSHPEVVKAAYIRQLRIYAYLVKQVLGWWPRRGLILPLAGPGVEVDVEPADCERETLEAVALLNTYNANIRAKIPPPGFAAPSPSACKWCPYKLVCPAFWQSASSAWSGQLAGASVEGIVAEPTRLIHGGAAMAVSVDIQAGSEAPRRVEIAPLNPAVHSAANVLTLGDRIRLVDLRVRPDGALLPTQRTVLARVNEVPELTVSLSNKDPDSR